MTAPAYAWHGEKIHSLAEYLAELHALLLLLPPTSPSRGTLIARIVAVECEIEARTVT